MKTRKTPPSSFWQRWLDRWSGDRAPAPPARGSATAEPDSHPRDTKLRRAARREHLYGVVRENMVRVGVLSSAYKFKVLTLDHDGLCHLVLIDIQPDALDSLPGGAQAAEASLRQLAMERLGVEVKSVYWRQMGASARQNAPSTAPMAAATHEAVIEDELQALHQAFDANANGSARSAPTDFEPTRPMLRARDSKGFTPLSDTQLGDLE